MILFMYFFDPYSPFLNYQIFNYLVYIYGFHLYVSLQIHAAALSDNQQNCVAIIIQNLYTYIHVARVTHIIIQTPITLH